MQWKRQMDSAPDFPSCSVKSLHQITGMCILDVPQVRHRWDFSTNVLSLGNCSESSLIPLSSTGRLETVPAGLFLRDVSATHEINSCQSVQIQIKDQKQLPGKLSQLFYTCMCANVCVDPYMDIHTKAWRERWVNRGTLEGQRACKEGYGCSITFHWNWQCEHIKMLLEHLYLSCRLPTALILPCVAADWSVWSQLTFGGTSQSRMLSFPDVFPY